MFENYLIPLLMAWAIGFVFMAILWLIHIPLKNAALVDVGWSMTLILMIWAYMLYFDNFSPLMLTLAAMVSIWGLRLAVYLFLTRIYRAEEEGRYITLREKWAPHELRAFFIFYQAQAFMNVFISLPFLLAAADSSVEMNTVHIVATALFIISFSGETASDLQLHFFKKKPENRGRVCDTGLWRYSRHPNYFFEIMVWVSWFIYAVQSDYGYLGIIPALLLLYSIFKITGIPATEEQNLKSKGEAYREYMKKTPMFIPRLPKKNVV